MFTDSILGDAGGFFLYDTNGSGTSIIGWSLGRGIGNYRGYYEMVEGGIEGSSRSAVSISNLVSGQTLWTHDLAVGDDGSFTIKLVANESADYGWYFRNFDSYGTPTSPLITIGEGSAYDDVGRSVVDISGSGDTVVLWGGITVLNDGEIGEYKTDDTLTLSVYSQDGEKLSDTVIVDNGNDDENYRNPSLTKLSDGSFLIAYHYGFWGRDIYFRTVTIDDSDNVSVSEEIKIPSEISFFSSIEMIPLANGNFVYTYNIGDLFKFQIFTPEGNAVSDLVEISESSWNFEIASIDNGGFVVAHAYDGTDDGVFNRGIYIDQFDNFGNRVGERQTVVEEPEDYHIENLIYENDQLYVIAESDYRYYTYTSEPADMLDYALIDTDQDNRIDWNEGFIVGDNAIVNAESFQLYRIYAAALGRSPDKGGFSYWQGRCQDGSSIEQIGDEFFWSSEMQAAMDMDANGDVSDNEFIQYLYANVLGREADSEGMAYWLSQLDSGQGKGNVLASFLNEEEFIEISIEGAVSFAEENLDLWA
ncbi:DUF4214 domain-containing protein [Marinobacterium arenosum]|uniref:DUF4214 domain-containing protein n=1 Tax=Marinobacterium arenosum TaxID=2862496 RepID=UPI001C956042|nr:DUF4214 domain-containing protein [Marinobacterium arenosum]MBY4676806.1 DUF4214 domain-containing protein [Marinobacterium arenosum]